MRKFFVSAFLVMGIATNVCAAVRTSAPARRGGAESSGNEISSKMDSTARSAVSQRNVRNNAPKMDATARSATKQPTVRARAATNQKVINTGTKVSGATQNIIVNEECQNKYFGCMDAFCMLDNASGGRCLCSDRNAELDAVLAEIERINQQSYQMATLGVEQIEMGENADAAIAKANAVAQSANNAVKNSTGTGRRSLDLSMWDMSVNFDDNEDIFAETGTMQSSIEGKTGDALNRAAGELCMAQIPECAADAQMLQSLYGQRIKSDCNAYENSLKQQRNESQTKLSAAQKALREAALEQMQTANRYDLGQCTAQFKRCMQTTGGCGDDFSECASVAATDNTNVIKTTSKKNKNYTIKGDMTTIEISASTYDTLLAKKPLCENVTKSCVAVADQVWDTFLRESAPSLKSAELIAEDKARQSCIGNISSCFQKACKDTIDPNDPEGSYDLCLTRPETVLNFCKIPLNACGVDVSSASKAQNSDIWNYVVARLASMRIDSCTKDVKSCLQSEDRCGSDYSQCIGLDTDSIIALCPTDKLVGCQENGNKMSVSEIYDLVAGIFLNIDNAMLAQCQSAVTNKMMELCGSTDSCAAFEDDDIIGTESLLSYKDNSGNYVIEGLVSFGDVEIKEVDNESGPDNVKFGRYEVDISEYKDHLNDTSAAIQRIVSSLQSTANKINQKIAILSEDPQIKMCVGGRNMSQIRSRSASGDTTAARFPNLLDSTMLTIIDSGMAQANKNYTNKYNKLVGEAFEKQDAEVKSVLCAAMASNAQPTCVHYNNSGACTKYETGNFDNMFSGTTSTGTNNNVNDPYATRYVITGANLSKLTSAQQSGHSEHAQTDSFGNTLARVAMDASYSESNGVCTLITETITCKTTQDIITTEKVTKKKGGFLGIGKKKKTTTKEVYQGTACTEWNDPVRTTTTINM